MNDKGSNGRNDTAHKLSADNQPQATPPYFSNSVPRDEIMLDEDSAKNVTNVKDVEKDK